MTLRLLLSEIAGSPLVGPGGDRVGRVADCVVRLVDGDLPRLTGIVLQVGGRDTFVRDGDLATVERDCVRLAVDRVGTRPFERRAGEVLLVRDVRERAVVDVSESRLVRVRDLVLEGEAAAWEVVGIVPAPVTSFSSLLRGLFRQADPVEEVVPWSNVQPLVGHVPAASRPPSFLRLAGLRPADIADIVEQASHEEGEEILDAVHQNRELEADVFEELDDEHQVEFLKDRSDPEAAAVLGNMAADDAADLLMQLPQERRRPVLELLPPARQRKVRLLLGYNPETAGGLMTPDFVALPEELTAAQALQRVRVGDDVPEGLTELYSLSGGHLSGSIPLAGLVRANPDARLVDLVANDPVAVGPDADISSAAVLMADYNLSALPVIDEAGTILGVITYDDMIEVMLPTDWRWRGRPGEVQTRRRPRAATAS